MPAFMMLFSLSMEMMLLLSLSIDFSSSAPECAAKCKCKWKNGKQTVECPDANLSGVPVGLKKGVQVLDLGGNILQNLPSRVFYNSGLVNLQKVHLMRCGITDISKDAFYQLSNLVELDLSSNFLTTVPSVIFEDCFNLRKLLLSHNPIEKITNHTFSNLKQLTSLELMHCHISAIDASAFLGLKSLLYLRLGGNKLTSLFIQSLPPLYALDLHDNPWHCDCKLAKLRTWMVKYNVPFSIPPECIGPERVKGLNWKELDLHDFVCQPVVETDQHKISIVEGANSTLVCKIKSISHVDINWIWQGRVIQNLSLMSFGRQIYLIRDYGTNERINTLTIINTLGKDSGRYTCLASNKAGNMSVNIYLMVTSRADEQEGMSGGEIAGIIIGVLLVITLFFITLCLFVLQGHASSCTQERKSFGAYLYKNFDSLKHNNTVEMNNISKLQPDREDDKSPGDEIFPANCVANKNLNVEAAVNCHPDSKYVITDLDKCSTRVADGVVCCDAKEDHNIIRQNSIEEDQKTWKYRRRDEDVDVLLSANKNNNIAQIHRTIEIEPPTVSVRNPGRGSLDPREENDPNLATWKRSPAHPFPLYLNGEARDSPDEGLGDEKEYETDILD